MTYNANQIVTDGRLTAPRWVQHLVKMLTSSAIFAAMFGVDHVARMIGALPHVAEPTPTWVFIVCGLIAGPVFWLLAAIHEHFWPTDPKVYPLWLHAADWATDCSLACLGGLVPGLSLGGQPITAAVLGVAFFCVYITCRHGARP